MARKAFAIGTVALAIGAGLFAQGRRPASPPGTAATEVGGKYDPKAEERDKAIAPGDNRPRREAARTRRRRRERTRRRRRRDGDVVVGTSWAWHGKEFYWRRDA